MNIMINNNINSENIIRRIGRLLYLCDDVQAKKIVQESLILFPDNKELLELESECICFLTRNLANYLKMLSKKTFFTVYHQERYITEIDGYCSMLSNNANNKICIAQYKDQNTDNYYNLLNYFFLLYDCYCNTNIKNYSEIYNCIKRSLVKMACVLCNTVYEKIRKNKKNIVALISIQQRRNIYNIFFELTSGDIDSDFRVIEEAEYQRIINRGNSR